jgi:hypothetical protein
MLQLFLVQMEAIPFLLLALKTKLAQQLRGSLQGEEEVETPSEKSMASRIPSSNQTPTGGHSYIQRARSAVDTATSRLDQSLN